MNTTFNICKQTAITKKNLNVLIYPLFSVLLEDKESDDNLSDSYMKELSKQGYIFVYDKKDGACTINSNTFDILNELTPDFSTTFYKDWNETIKNFKSGIHFFNVIGQYLIDYRQDKFDNMLRILLEQMSTTSYTEIASSDLSKITEQMKIVRIVDEQALKNIILEKLSSAWIPNITEQRILIDLLELCGETYQSNEDTKYFSNKLDLGILIKYLSKEIYLNIEEKIASRDIRSILIMARLATYIVSSSDEFFRLLATKLQVPFVKNKMLKKHLMSKIGLKIKFLISEQKIEKPVKKIENMNFEASVDTDKKILPLKDSLNFEANLNKAKEMICFIINNLSNMEVLSRGYNRHKHLFIAIKKCFRYALENEENNITAGDFLSSIKNYDKENIIASNIYKEIKTANEQSSIYDIVIKRINKIAKLSKTHHKPFILNEKLHIVSTCNLELLDSCTLSELIKIYKTVADSIVCSEKGFRYKSIIIRNGKVFYKQYKNIDNINEHKNFKNSIKQKIIVRMKKLYAGYEIFYTDDYFKPAVISRRKGLYDNIALGSKIKITVPITQAKSNELINFGIYWKEANDYDLSAIVNDVLYDSQKNIKVVRSQTNVDFTTINSFREKPITEQEKTNTFMAHSGDITNGAREGGAAELLLIRNYQYFCGKDILIKIYDYSGKTSDNVFVHFGFLKTKDYYSECYNKNYSKMKEMAEEERYDVISKFITSIRIPTSIFEISRGITIGLLRIEKVNECFEFNFTFDILVNDNSNVYQKIDDISNIDDATDAKQKWKTNTNEMKKYEEILSANKLSEIDNNLYLDDLLLEIGLTKLSKQELESSNKRVLDISIEGLKNNVNFWNDYLL